MIPRRSFALGLALVASLGLATRSRPAHAASRYTTRGTIKSFGKARRYVNIAHEEIPGYMLAMTMSFEPSGPTQLDGYEPGDRVELTFLDEGQRRVIERIAKV